jgi:hypothetical protein
MEGTGQCTYPGLDGSNSDISLGKPELGVDDGFVSISHPSFPYSPLVIESQHLTPSDSR